jgi:hypothetical protein
VNTRSWAYSEMAESVAKRAPASLTEVTEQAALRVRVDRKYMVPVDHFGELMARLSQRYTVLEIDGRRAFAYESVYFDTSDLLTCRQHLQGRRRRYKVRTRAYLDTAYCAFEVKFNGARSRPSRRSCRTGSPTGPLSPRRRGRSSPASSRMRMVCRRLSCRHG